MKTTVVGTAISYFYEHWDLFDFAPPYQRQGGIWKTPQKQGLIDSILAGYDVPKFYIHRVSDKQRAKYKAEGHAYKYAVIDGKQRLTAIKEFIDGGYPIGDDFYVPDAHTRPGSAPRPGDYYADLTPDWKNELLSRELDLCEVTIDQDDEEAVRIIREIFRRLNMGKALSTGELDRARSGPLADLVRALEEHVFIKEYIAFDDKRAQHLIFIKYLVAMEYAAFIAENPARAPKSAKAVKEKKAPEATLSVKHPMICDRGNDALSKLLDAKGGEWSTIAEELKPRLDHRLDNLRAYFPLDKAGKPHPLMARRSSIDAFVVLIDLLEDRAGGVKPEKVRQFLEEFEAARGEASKSVRKMVKAGRTSEAETVDQTIAQYNVLVGQGTPGKTNLADRVRILRDQFLAWEKRA